MRRKRLNQDGSHIIGMLLAVVVLVVIVFVGLKVLHKSSDKASGSNQAQQSQNSSSGKSDSVVWAYNMKNNEWYAQSGQPTKCADPFIFDKTPVDLSGVEVIGMPGQYRGFNYKPHGAIRLYDNSNGQASVVMPTDATLVSLKRYYESNELQYLLTFETDCGIAFRFDHLRTLTPAFQAIAETTPAPTTSTASDPNAPFQRTKFKSGDLVATDVGFANNRNYGFDFGAYDYRHRNEISKNKQWAAIHNQYQATEWFGTCFVTQMPAADAAKAKKLSLTVINPARPNIISDYCTYAPYTTLDFNNGQPTDG
jgi:hypothetical protein